MLSPSVVSGTEYVLKLTTTALGRSIQHRRVLCHNQLNSSSRRVLDSLERQTLDSSCARVSLGSVCVNHRALCLEHDQTTSSACFLHHTSSYVMIAAGEMQEEEVQVLSQETLSRRYWLGVVSGMEYFLKLIMNVCLSYVLNHILDLQTQNSAVITKNDEQFTV